MTTMLRSLLAKVGRDQELRIRPVDDGKRIEVAISNHIVLAGERDVILAIFEEPCPSPPSPNQLAMSWLDCVDCRALSKSGANPPRCSLHIAVERGVD